MTDEAVAAKIKAGGPGMVAFGHTLTDADIADLISYLRSPRCCYENDEPPKNPHYQAETHRWPVSNALKGGARGVVRAKSGQLLEGIKVQLIAPNAVRTTVFTDSDGRYEFPAMQAGSYTLRIATPAPYKAYVREGVPITGATTLEEIVLEPIPSAAGPDDLKGALPPTPEAISQLSGAEILWNLSGTMQAKTTFAKGCNNGCHSYELIFRNRYDEHSWDLIVDRMTKYRAASLLPPRNESSDAARASKAEHEAIVKWLATVRGPDSQDAAVRRHAGEAAFLPRCQVHKRRNGLDPLPEEHRPGGKRKLPNAYAMTEYADVKRALEKLHRELLDLNPSAARSLAEGMEETLPVHRLRVPPKLRRSLASTHGIESAFSIVETVCRNGKRWRPGDQIERWVGSGLLVAERQFRRIRGFREIPLLLASLANTVSQKSVANVAAVA